MHGVSQAVPDVLFLFCIVCFRVALDLGQILMIPPSRPRSAALPASSERPPLDQPSSGATAAAEEASAGHGGPAAGGDAATAPADTLEPPPAGAYIMKGGESGMLYSGVEVAAGAKYMGMAPVDEGDDGAGATHSVGQSWEWC